MALKADIERALSDLTATVNPLLTALRRHGRCCLCQAEEGQQHDLTCPAWPMIIARANASYIQDPDDPPLI